MQKPNEGLSVSELRQLQSVQKELLTLVLERCEELQVSAIAVAGTALGAARHGDVIPWDDDVDIGLFRDEYNVLLESLTTRPIDGVVLQTHLTEPAYPMAFAKVRKVGTRVFGDVLDTLPLSHGIFIDIFPIDILPASKVMRKVQRLALHGCRLVIFSAGTFVETSSSGFVKVYRRLLAPVCSRIPSSRVKRARDWISEWPIGRRSETSISFEMYGLRGASRTEIEVNRLLPTKEMPFGQIRIPMPNDSHAYLTKTFGDYSKLPPADEQRPPHIYRVDFNGAGPQPS